jgi:hypothetical protein
VVNASHTNKNVLIDPIMIFILNFVKRKITGNGQAIIYRSQNFYIYFWQNIIGLI